MASPPRGAAPAGVPGRAVGGWRCYGCSPPDDAPWIRSSWCATCCPRTCARRSRGSCLPDALRHRLAQRVDTAAVDWPRTRAYCLPTDLEGHIRINLRGREPQGSVAPGPEYQRVCDELAAALEALTQPETGRRAVRAVLRTDDLYPGPETRLPSRPHRALGRRGAVHRARIPGRRNRDRAVARRTPRHARAPGILIRAGRGAEGLGRVGHICRARAGAAAPLRRGGRRTTWDGRRPRCRPDPGEACRDGETAPGGRRDPGEPLGRDRPGPS